MVFFLFPINFFQKKIFSIGESDRIYTDENGRKRTNDDENKALYWRKIGDRTLFFNKTLPTIKKNVDICLYKCNYKEYDGQFRIDDTFALAFAELKGGIDPAGADEHWKTANSSLNRIRRHFHSKGINVNTAFIAAAIEKSMAQEIWEQLSDGTLNYAANLTNDNQLTFFCSWLIHISDN